MANAMLSPEKNVVFPSEKVEDKTSRKRKVDTTASKKPSKSAKADSVSSQHSVASSVKDRSSDVHRPDVSPGPCGSAPSITDVMNALKSIQEGQCKSVQNFNVLSHRVDELFRMAEEYDDCGDYGLVPDSDVVTVNDDNAADHDTCQTQSADTQSTVHKDSVTLSGADNKFKLAGDKLKIKEVCDTSVNSELASCVNDWFRQGIEDDRYTELTKDSVNARPDNCEGLVTVKTNQLVWGFWQPNTRTVDKKLQNVETSVVKTATILVKVCDKIGKLDDPCVFDMIDRSMEALALLGQSNYQINMLRRELMKTNMKGEYSHLCSHNVKYTSYLFGDDVPKTVKEIGDCSRISNKLSSFATQQRSDRGFSNRNRP
jgi:hypothetical protein